MQGGREECNMMGMPWKLFKTVLGNFGVCLFRFVYKRKVSECKVHSDK